MNQDALTSVLELDGEERYDYFLSQVGEEREIWILVNTENRFLKIVSEEPQKRSQRQAFNSKAALHRSFLIYG